MAKTKPEKLLLQNTPAIFRIIEQSIRKKN